VVADGLVGDGTAPTAQADPQLAAAAQQLVQQLQQAIVGRQFKVAKVDAAKGVAYLATEGAPLSAGTELDLVQLGEAIVLDGKELGREETVLGKLVWDRTQGDTLGICNIKDLEQGKELGGPDVVAYYRAQVPFPLALVPACNADKQPTQFGLDIAQQLELALKKQEKLKDSVIGLETTRDNLLRRGLSMADLFDPKKSPVIAEATNAKSVALATVTKSDLALSVVMRVVNLETGLDATKLIAYVTPTEERVAKAGEVVGWPGGTTQIEGLSLFSPTLKRITRDGTAKAVEDVTIGGIYWPKATAWHGDETIVLNRVWKTLHAEFGVNEKASAGRYAVTFTCDGQEAKQVTVEMGKVPTVLDLDVTGVTALSVRCGKTNMSQPEDLVWSPATMLLTRPPLGQ
jgi:hypothetical protein